MIRLDLRGRVGTREHVALLADVRRCDRCTTPTAGAAPVVRPVPRIPRVRVEQSVRDLEAARR